MLQTTVWTEVFKGFPGGKIKAISKTFRLVVDTIGFNKGIQDRRQVVTFHTLRHTFASWFALQGETHPDYQRTDGAQDP